MPVIYFRVDGNREIATGHIMRSLSVARACAALGADVRFLVSDEESMSVLTKRFAFPDEFPRYCLQSDYKNMEAELPALLPILQSADSPCLFIDSYSVTDAYLSKLRSVCRTAYLDDVLAFDYPVDCIINYDITEMPDCYRKASQCLLGPAYTPLRGQFQNVRYEVRPAVRNILLSTGGTDYGNIAGTLLTKLYGGFSDALIDDCHYHVITSRLNSHFADLEDLARRHPSVHIHENVSDMAGLMRECDLALSAGGTTLYELCAVGVPSISFSIADNQLLAVETLAEKNIIPYAGDVRKSAEDVMDTLLVFLTGHICSRENYELRKKSSRQMRAFLDGNGSVRIAKALITLSAAP